MPTLIEKPTVIQSAGNKPKRIKEYAGLLNSGNEQVSVVRMVSPEGWMEPGQRPWSILGSGLLCPTSILSWTPIGQGGIISL